MNLNFRAALGGTLRVGWLLGGAVLGGILFDHPGAAADAPAEPPVEPATLVTLDHIRAAASSSDWAFQQLEALTDGIGPRLSGSPAMAAAVTQVAAALRALGAKVTLQPVKVHHWVRGEERAELTEYAGRPDGVRQRLHLTALGSSSATPAAGLEARVIVVHDFDELKARAAEVRGNIVLFDAHFDQRLAQNGHALEAYEQSGAYRFVGPSAAASVGAAAALVRSIGGADYRLPHTGATRWQAQQAPIPSAALAAEDADMLARLAARGPLSMRLVLTPETLPPADSFNVIADWPGSDRPNEYVIVSGHLDSWDLGTGATDDGVGVLAAAGVIKLLQQLNLHPHRSIRFIAWTDEESGSPGARAYFDSVRGALETQCAAIESDAGAGRALGIEAAVTADSLARLRPVATALAPLGATVIEPRAGELGSDIAALQAAGVPGFAPLVDTRHYFDYHHTAADTLDKVDPVNLQSQTATMAVLAYYLAELPGCLPRVPPVSHDLVLRNGVIYDGSGNNPYPGDVAIDGDRLSYVGPHTQLAARTEIDVKGQAIAPGFVNMLAHPEESLFADGRALSDLAQGVTLEVLGEDSMGPLNQSMRDLLIQRQGDIKYPVTWSTLGQYLETLQRRGISPNVASFVGAATVRTFVLGERDVQPTAPQLEAMRTLVRSAMEEGALGLTTALIYAPATYAKTPELIALAQESARCGGIYTAHMRSEGDRIEAAVAETIEIAKASGAPAEIYHLKLSGKDNWGKLDRVVDMIEGARAAGVRISANMYTYTAGATGLDAAMPAWVQDGGLEAWIARLKDPAVRARVIAEMRNPHPATWENLYGAAGADGTLMLAFKNPKLKPLTGKTLAEVARSRGVSPEDAAIDLVIEDGSRVGVAYFLMSEDNIRREVALPWVSFGSDEAGDAPEGVFLLSAAHPRAYGNFARVLAQYVRKDHALELAAAVRKLTSLPADNLSLADRGRLQAGAFADVVVFDPDTIQDHATFDQPHQLSTGVSTVIVNGTLAIAGGVPTGAASGRVVHGRAWTGAADGGCRASAKDWTWSM